MAACLPRPAHGPRAAGALCPSSTHPAATVLRGHGGRSCPLPFLVLAVEQPVEDLAQGADVVQVVQDDDEGHVPSAVLTAALVGKVGQVLAQFLGRSGEDSAGECSPIKTDVLEAFTLPRSTQVERPLRRLW